MNRVKLVVIILLNTSTYLQGSGAIQLVALEQGLRSFTASATLEEEGIGGFLTDAEQALLTINANFLKDLSAITTSDEAQGILRAIEESRAPIDLLIEEFESRSRDNRTAFKVPLEETRFATLNTAYEKLRAYITLLKDHQKKLEKAEGAQPKLSDDELRLLAHAQSSIDRITELVKPYADQMFSPLKMLMIDRDELAKLGLDKVTELATQVAKLWEVVGKANTELGLQGLSAHVAFNKYKSYPGEDRKLMQAFLGGRDEIQEAVNDIEAVKAQLAG